jgi:phage-related minor tail protein
MSSVQIDVGLNANGVKAGANEVVAVVDGMASKVATAAGATSKAVEKIGDGSGAAAEKLDRSTRSIISSIQRTTAVLEAGERGSAKFYEALAAQRGISADTLKPYLGQLEAARVKQDAAARSLAGVGMSAKATTAALRQVPAQFTDIVTSLASGQAPLTVLLQQGGQLKDVFGGIGSAARALGGYIVGLINPFTVAGAAIAGIAYAYSKGAEEAQTFRRTIIETGAAAGISAAQLQAMSASLGAVNGSQSAAAEALNLFAQTGRVGVDSIERFSRAALDLERSGGQSVKKTAEAFADLAKEPYKAVLKLDEAMNFLSVSAQRQI